MKLRAKLMLGPAVSGLMLMGVLAASLWTAQMQRQATISGDHATIARTEQHAKQRDQFAAVHMQLYRGMTIIASLDDKAVKTLREQLKRQLTDLSADFSKQAQALPKGDAAIEPLTKLAATATRYLTAADSAIDLSTVDPNTGVAALQLANVEYKSLTALLGQWQAVGERNDAARDEEQQSRADQTSLAIAVIGLLAALGSLTYSWFTQRRMAAEIEAGAHAAQRVAEGHLDEQPSSDTQDELGDLMRALGAMVGQLRTTIHSVQQASVLIGSASSEIAAGNQDLSQRTEDTASSLQQTASSVEQLNNTVRQSADAAATANQLAASAAQVAQRGGEVVSKVVHTMNEINSSSKKIADIISVIDGIAFQTNILALNAAVEAARAGEQGRGFAVVASEVRSLAQRSAEAAREIKGLIGTSVSKVEAGARLVHDAGQTMVEIVASVQRVTDVIGEISAAAGEQSAGLSQVTDAVVTFDQMTQRNAALVQQSTAAAESLHGEANRLALLVSTFALGSGNDSFSGVKSATLPAAHAPSRPVAAASRPSEGGHAQSDKSALLAAAPAAVAAAAAGESDWESF